MKLLFIGDSITDMSRNREGHNPYSMGNGYVFLLEAALAKKYPGKYEVINRGISGNRIVDLYARIKADFINLKPDYASIFIGVNDAWHEIGHQNGVDTAKFEKIYEMLLEEIYAACPDIKLMIIAPFVLEGSATCDTEEKPDRLNQFRVDVAEKNAVAKRIAAKYNLPCIDLQAAFDEACTKAGPDYWTRDGVHPTANGHEMIKRLWLKTFEEMN